ncbi:MAG: hypothetical protein SFT92_02780 [Rickettsiales bacterium]|nr:hypothetical protein [Rickettsiales bacterium]
MENASRIRPTVTPQIKAVVRAFELLWYVDEESGHVRVRFAPYVPELLGFLKGKGFAMHDLSSLSDIQELRKQADFLTYVELEPDHLRRNDEKSFVEILHPGLNAFIKAEILGLKQKSGGDFLAH